MSRLDFLVLGTFILGTFIQIVTRIPKRKSSLKQKPKQQQSLFQDQQ